VGDSFRGLTGDWATGRLGGSIGRIWATAGEPTRRGLGHTSTWSARRPGDSSVRGRASCCSETGRRGQRGRSAFHRHPGRD